MGRRSSHTSDELRELIIRETITLVEEQGYSSLSAREIARRIEYSPGTLYNIFENLDDLVITIEGRLLDRLLEVVAAVAQDQAEATGRRRVLDIMRAYLTFAQQNQQLWRLLGEHRLSAGAKLPNWYHEKFSSIQAYIGDALSSALPSAITKERLGIAAHGLWVVVHGVSGLSTCSKLDVLPSKTAHELLDDLIGTYIDGLISMV